MITDAELCKVADASQSHNGLLRGSFDSYNYGGWGRPPFGCSKRASGLVRFNSHSLSDSWNRDSDKVCSTNANCDKLICWAGPACAGSSQIAFVQEIASAKDAIAKLEEEAREEAGGDPTELLESRADLQNFQNQLIEAQFQNQLQNQTLPCKCGASICSESTGSICTGNTCSHSEIINALPCTFTNGTKQNTENCNCGQETCNFNDGMVFCYFDSIGFPSGSCKKKKRKFWISNCSNR